MMLILKYFPEFSERAMNNNLPVVKRSFLGSWEKGEKKLTEKQNIDNVKFYKESAGYDPLGIYDTILSVEMRNSIKIHKAFMQHRFWNKDIWPGVLPLSLTSKFQTFPNSVSQLKN